LRPLAPLCWQPNELSSVSAGIVAQRIIVIDIKDDETNAQAATPKGASSLIAAAEDADILVNNLGSARPKPFAEITDQDWLDLFQFNVMSGVRMTCHLLPRMVEHGWGRVVCISSESATTDEVATMVVYVCSDQASATSGAALRVDGGVVRYVA